MNFCEREPQNGNRSDGCAFIWRRTRATNRAPLRSWRPIPRGFGAGGQLRHQPLRKALEHYAGAKNRAALINLLAPVQKAAETCDWVKALVDTGDLYQPMAWSADHAYQLLRSVPALEASGLSVRLPDWWRKRARPHVSVTIGSRTPSGIGLEALLDFNVEVALGGEPLTADEIDALLDGDEALVLLKGQWVEVDRDRLQQAIAHWENVRQQARDGGISFVEGMRLLAGASADLEHEDQAEAERPWVHVQAGGACATSSRTCAMPGRRRLPGWTPTSCPGPCRAPCGRINVRD